MNGYKAKEMLQTSRALRDLIAKNSGKNFEFDDTDYDCGEFAFNDGIWSYSSKTYNGNFWEIIFDEKSDSMRINMKNNVKNLSSNCELFELERMVIAFYS
jgi:hypothetical protein